MFRLINRLLKIKLNQNFPLMVIEMLKDRPFSVMALLVIYNRQRLFYSKSKMYEVNYNWHLLSVRP